MSKTDLALETIFGILKWALGTGFGVLVLRGINREWLDSNLVWLIIWMLSLEMISCHWKIAKAKYA